MEVAKRGPGRPRKMAEQPFMPQVHSVVVRMVEPEAPKCGNCAYLRHNGAYDECKRFPQAVKTTAADWCGEHKRKPEKA